MSTTWRGKKDSRELGHARHLAPHPVSPKPLLGLPDGWTEDLRTPPFGWGQGEGRRERPCLLSPPHFPPQGGTPMSAGGDTEPAGRRVRLAPPRYRALPQSAQHSVALCPGCLLLPPSCTWNRPFVLPTSSCLLWEALPAAPGCFSPSKQSSHCAEMGYPLLPSFMGACACACTHTPHMHTHVCNAQGRGDGLATSGPSAASAQPPAELVLSR